jgi:pyrrolidone-carboxylate peptidase
MATPERSTLRLSDLKTRTLVGMRVISMKLPNEVVSAIDRLAKELNATKTHVVVALLHEGMAIAHKKR